MSEQLEFYLKEDKRLKIDMTQISKFTHLHHKINLSSVKQPNLSFPSDDRVAIFCHMCQKAEHRICSKPKIKISVSSVKDLLIGIMQWKS